MQRILLVLIVALVMAAMMAATVSMAAFAAQPQSGQPGLTEGKNGPPPFPHHH